MKKMIKYLTIGLVVFTVASCGEHSHDSDENHSHEEGSSVEISAENLLAVDYSIKGMVCSMGCAKTIEEEVAHMDGVANCTVDFESEKAHIEFDKTQLSEKEIIAQIESIADGQYKVEEYKEGKIEEIEDENTEGSDGQVEASIPSIEVPNLFNFFINQL